MDEHVGRRRRARAAARRLAVPERRREAERSVDGARRRAGRALAPAAAEHHPLDQVDRHRSRIGRRRGGAHAGPRRRALQADQQRPVPERLPRVRVPLHAAGGDAARSAGARRPVSGPIEHRPLARPPPRASAAAATPGSFPTKRSSGATAIGRIRRRFRHGCRNSACGCTACRAIERGDGPVHRAGQHGGRVRAAGHRLHRRRHRRDLPGGGGRTAAAARGAIARRGPGPGASARMRKAELKRRHRVGRSSGDAVSSSWVVGLGRARRRLEHVLLAEPHVHARARHLHLDLPAPLRADPGFFE